MCHPPRHTFLPPSFFPPSSRHHLQPALLHQPSRECDFCAVELLFLFVPFSPWLPARRLAAPVCQRWLQQNRLWEQPVSLPWSPAPQPEGQPSIQRSPCPLHTQMPNQTHTHTKKPTTLTTSPIILGSNFISTRVAAHCRQPLQSFLINSRFVPHPSFWTHLSYIPIGAAPSTPRQPPFANPTASPTSRPTPRNSYCFFFPTCRSPTYRVR